MRQFVLGFEQKYAVKNALNWLNFGYYEKPIFVIGGYAGTGKSTIVDHMIKLTGIPKHKIAYVTFTGKAAVVLRSKNIDAVTAHRLIYNTYISPGRPPSFKRKPKIPGNIELIVIDELGMLPENITNDILKFNIPTIGLGDPGQLPPIFGENKYILTPDVFLTECYRTVGPALALATDIRNNTFNPNKKYGKGVIFKHMDEIDAKDLIKYDQVLCGTNHTRAHLNMIMRKQLGYSSKYPKAGEKIVCTMNNFRDKLGEYNGVEMCLVNGLICTLVSDVQIINDNVGIIYFKPDFVNITYSAYCKLSDFDINIEKTDDFQNMQHEFFSDKIVNRFDYAYAITVHKAQGSEWNKVCVINDCFYKDASMISRWLYTAVTRTKKEVTVYL